MYDKCKDNWEKVLKATGTADVTIKKIYDELNEFKYWTIVKTPEKYE